MEVTQWESPKNTFTINLKKETVDITLTSNFDSGNLAKAELGLNNAIVITPAQDCSQFGNPSHSKGWFHFTVTGPPFGCKLKFIVKKMSPLATQVHRVGISSNSATTFVLFFVGQERNGSGSSRQLFSYLICEVDKRR